LLIVLLDVDTCQVRYPGLDSFPQKELADRQHTGGMHGAMLWFEVRGGTEAGRALMNSVQVRDRSLHSISASFTYDGGPW